jgi:hypothetical protein
MLRFGAYKREFKLVNDGNDRKTTLSDTKGDVEAAAEPAKSAGGFTKRQLWVAPLVMAVNLPGSVFAQVSPVGTPAPAPIPAPTPLVPTPSPVPTPAPAPTP